MDDLTIVIKTLDRYICLKPLLKSIIKKYNNIPILVGDDSLKSCKKQIEKDFPNANIEVYELPHDCGLSFGRNYLVKKVKTEYFCLCDDDFIFDNKTDLETALNILKEKELDIIGGYMRNYKIINSPKDRIIKVVQKLLRYELPTNYIGNFKEENNILTINYRIHDFPEYEKVEIVNNFFIAKTKVILNNLWDNDLKLQEHTAFFYEAKKKNVKVGFTNKLSVRHCPIQNFKYKNYRTRNYTHVFMEKHNIKKIISNFDDKKRNNVFELPKIDNILFSVIVPVYNSENKMDLLVKTLKEQTYKNFEVIFVNNNSIDNTEKYLKKLIGDDKRFRIEFEKKQGPNYARKKGFELSKGEYIYFCDSDDYLEDDTLYHFACEISKNDSDIVIGDYIEHFDNNRKYMKGIFQNYNDNLQKHKDILLIKPAIWNKIFKRNLITDNSFLFTNIFEDGHITLLSMVRSTKITYINKVVYHYLSSNYGLSATCSYKNLISLIDTQVEIKKVFIEEKKFDKYKEEINYIFITHCIYRMLRITLLDKKNDKKSAYDKYLKYIKTIDKNNKYLKKSRAFSLAYYIVCHKFCFRIFSPFIKILFTNKIINKCFKRLDR